VKRETPAPPRPQCVGQAGVLKCAPTCDVNCMAARGIWLRAENIAGFATDGQRADTLRAYEQCISRDYADKVRAATWALLQARKDAEAQPQGSLL
jgi:hypothetical protein